MRNAPPSAGPAPLGSAPPPPPPPRAELAPATLSVPPLTAPVVLPPPRANRLELTLIGVAAALGLLLTLNRNGALAALFTAVGQQSTYQSLEASLGGPGSGTPRAVEALINKR